MKMVKTLLALLISFNLTAQIETGIKAPEITLEGIYNREGNEVPTLKELQGKIVILDFWAIWCSPCIAAFPEMNELQAKFKEDVVFIAITDDPKDKLENFLEKVQLDFWIGRDADKQDFSNYKVKGRPQTYIINRNGIIVYQGHHVTKELLEEVIATNSVSLPEKKNYTQKVILNGGFSPGEDPLYNAMSIMLGNEPSNRPVLIDHFIIRPSLDTSWGGNGHKSTIDGFIGVTYYSGQLVNIIQFLRNLSSPIWVKNKTSDTSRYDIIYWKKAKNTRAAFMEIEQRLLEGVSIKLDSIQVKQAVNILFINKRNEHIKMPDEIEDGTYNAYTSISTFLSQLEYKSEQYHIADEDLQNGFIYNRGMEWKKLNDASAAEITEFLKSRGILLRKEERRITLYEINSK